MKMGIILLALFSIYGALHINTDLSKKIDGVDTELSNVATCKRY